MKISLGCSFLSPTIVVVLGRYCRYQLALSLVMTLTTKSKAFAAPHRVISSPQVEFSDICKHAAREKV